MYRSIESRLGTRGIALALLGFMWIGRGLVIANEPGQVNPIYFHTLLPLWLRLVLWVGTGVIALMACWRPRWHWVAWTVITIAPAERALSYLWAIVWWIIPGGPAGSAWATAYALWWTANVALLLVMSRWQEDNPEHGSRSWRKRRT